jgi:putative Mn2+ efflux pump MntP
MEILTTSIIIGIGLAMDCFAVSLAAGAYRPAARAKTALVLASVFGLSQFGMCLLGWVLGVGFAVLISAYDHWVAFFLLLVIGIRMIREGVEEREEEAPLAVFTPATVTALAVATSIDSLAVGISFAVLEIVPLIPALIIGAVSLAFSVAGVFSGTRLERILGRRVDILGGAILILIGIRVVLEHTVWAG